MEQHFRREPWRIVRLSTILSFSTTFAFVTGCDPAPVQSNGTACVLEAQCASGHCVDNVCCNSGCSGVCEACSHIKTGASDGQCAPILGNTDPDGECMFACNGKGACAKAPDGTACLFASECASGHCIDNVCCNSACTGVCEACSMAKTGALDGQCAPILANTNPDDECNFACDGMGACAKAPDGLVCTAGSDCLSGFCVDGICCNSECSGVCEACSMAKTGASDGQCAPILASTNPEDECNFACDGMGACAKAPDGFQCTAASDCLSGFCVDGICCNAECSGVCEACSMAKTGAIDGQCAPILTGTDPDDDCPLGKCDAMGICTVLAVDGTPCIANSQCGSDACVDGVCCDTICTGACVACNLPLSIGTCTPIPAGQSDPTGTPACNDSCDGLGACVKPPGASCVSGLECSSRICRKTVCESPKPANGPLQWMTIAEYPLSYPFSKDVTVTLLTAIAAYPKGGVALNGYTPNAYYDVWVILTGSYGSDGVPHPNRWEGTMNANYPGQLGYEIARGGVFESWERTGQFTHSTCFPHGCGNASVYALIGANDAGQHGSWVWPCDGLNCQSFDFGDGIPTSDMSLLRYDRHDDLELKILPPAGMGGRIVLGPKGEFYSGSATNLAKHNVNGGFLWSKSASLSGTIQSSAWDVDAHGNVLVALGFSGSVDYGSGPLTAVGPRDLGLIKLSPNGTVVWQKQYGNASFTMGTVGLSRAGLGDMAVWGDYAGSMNFGTGSLSGAKFIVKLDALGNAIWHVDILSGDGLKVSADALGAVYAGSSSFDTNFGWGTPLLNETVIAVAKYKDCPGPSGCKGNGLACKTGDVCSSGLCVDGLCCDRACDGLCEACSVSKKGQGTDGMCEAIAAGLDPDDECAFACNGLRQCAPNGAAHDMSSKERAVCTERDL